ncbi:ribonuclease P protein component [Streptococcus didelphis]|uniref:Ribonuclease P protein component n=1 Tax=Streptococcus didelphis TaxID=102886 RepID=A0ABY9LFW4_9STRE|nr:ribonuclease P protein component [Streptococcus didelphis]WMB27749.1 ribonuclease P protein component [Streptococcus didelphis]
MKKSYRVKREKDFQAIFDGGESKANRKFVIYFLDKEQDHFRVGISVGKKLGNAVIRNAVKRKIRHVIMELSDHLKKDDFVVIARKGVETLDYKDLRRNLQHVLRLANLLEEGFEIEKEN